MSQTYLGVLVMLLAAVLPKLGVNVGTDELTTTVSTIITVVGALWAFWGRYRLGGLKWFGARV